MNKKIGVAIAVVLVAIVLIYYMPEPVSDGEEILPGVNVSGTDEIEEPEEPEIELGVKEFSVVAKEWEFEPNEIVVDYGDNVKINVRSEDRTHGFYIDIYHIYVEVNEGGEKTLEFVADKEGSFRLFNHVYSGHTQMNGTFIVRG